MSTTFKNSINHDTITITDLQLRDQKYLWHPLTQMKLKPANLPIVKAKDALLFDEGGNSYIDCMASWFTCVYGHCNPYIIRKVTEQLNKLDHVMFTDFTHEPAIELSEILMKILPSNQAKIFFSDNGSTANETAIKMALQYFHNQNINKSKIVTFCNAFHGDTLGAMSASNLDAYNGPFSKYLLPFERIPVPTNENWDDVKKQFIKLLEKNEVAAFLFEPLVQGANCVHFYNPNLLDQLISIAKKYNVLTIADEAWTGFGKTGKYFACDYLQNKPDIICIAKALTGGSSSMGITTCTQDIYDAFYDDDIAKGFFHCHTYFANPITCAAGIASIELLTSNEMQDNIKRISAHHKNFVQNIQNHPLVKNARHLGVIFAMDLNIETQRYGQLKDQLVNFFISRGVFLRPVGNTIYMVPPFVTTDEQLKKVYATIEESLNMIF